MNYAPTFALIALFASPFSALAQDTRPAEPAPETRPAETRPQEELRRDPKALKAFRDMSQTVYRAREQGLQRVEFDLDISSYAFANPARVQTAGPFRGVWTPEKVTIVDAEGETPAINDADLQRLFGDLVGFDTEDILDDHHVELTADGVIRVGLPSHVEQTVRRIEFVRDEEGRLLTQKLIDKNDKELMSRRYAYKTLGEHTLVRAMVNTGAVESDTVLEHHEVDGYIFPKTVTTQTLVGVRTITYSNVVPTPKKKTEVEDAAPESAPVPAPPAEEPRPTDPPREDG